MFNKSQYDWSEMQMYLETTVYHQGIIGEHSKINQKNNYHGKHQCA